MSAAFGKEMQPPRNLLGAAAREEPFKRISLPDPPHYKRPHQLWDPPLPSRSHPGSARGRKEQEWHPGAQSGP